MSDDAAPAADQARARRALGLPDDAPVSLRALDAGAYHEHTLAEGGDRAAVLRVPTGSQWGLPLAAQLDREHRTLHALEGTGVAPAPLGLLAGEEPPVLVEEHVAGRAFSYATDLPALGRALAAVHAVPAPAHLPRVDAATALLDDAWERLGTAAPGEAHDLLAARAAELEPAGGAAPRDLLGHRAEPAVEVALDDVTIVHTDVHPGNLVVTGDGRVRMLDWEAARVGAPAWDLAHAIAPTTTLWDPAAAAELGPDEVGALLGAYAAARGEDLGDVAARVRALLGVVVVRALSWVLSAHAEGLRAGVDRALRRPGLRQLGAGVGPGWRAIAVNIASRTRAGSRSASTSVSRTGRVKSCAAAASSRASGRRSSVTDPGSATAATQATSQRTLRPRASRFPPCASSHASAMSAR
jgi:aminoglycoside phosphotransferase (APT) family kinase protein